MSRILFVITVWTVVFFAAPAEAQQDGAKILVCQLSAIIPQNADRDVTIYRRGNLKKGRCPAQFNVVDATGRVYKLAALIRATPNVPADTACGANLNAVIKYNIGEDGRTNTVGALSGSPEEWVRRSVKAVTKERYEPYTENNEPIEIIGVTITYKGEVEC